VLAQGLRAKPISIGPVLAGQSCRRRGVLDRKKLRWWCERCGLTHDVPDYCVVAGAPARIIKSMTPVSASGVVPHNHACGREVVLALSQHVLLAPLIDRLQDCLIAWRDFLSKQVNMADLKVKKRGIVRIGRHSYGVPIFIGYTGSERKVIIAISVPLRATLRIVTEALTRGLVSYIPFRINWHLPGAHADGLPSSNGDVIMDQTYG
jgi:hypothetical protein